ncbi:MAG: hypothetical protein MJK14_08310 [Rivularia sp. ALOHA_DT_140]|nr:hypothetical protein [Rivularia sp. ALOHA_DT_140]
MPEIYSAQIQKYLGREALMQRRIPILNCLWNDVLHFSTVHPNQIRNAFINLNLKWYSRNWFQINPLKIAFCTENTAIYINQRVPKKKGDLGNFSFTNIEYYPFSQELLDKLTELPAVNLEYLNFAKANRERPLLFQNVPHVLYYGSINLDDVEIIYC